MAASPTVADEVPTGAPGTGGDPPRSLLDSKRSRTGDTVFKAAALLSGLTVLVVLAGIFVSTTKEAWPAFAHQGLSFLYSSDWNPPAEQFGALAFIYGTVVISIIALVIGVPVSLGIALLVNEAAPRWLKTPARYVMDLLAAIPSVVYGLWGVLVLAPAIQPVYAKISETVGTWPGFSWIFGGTASGKSFMTAGLILAIMITPIVTSLSREVIATVPSSQREAAMALGATRWEMIRESIFPWARGGIVGSVMLGLGRAIGETIAAALVIGSSPQIVTQIFEPGDAMAAVIANQFGQSEGLFRSALIGLGVVLFVLTILVNMSARSIVTRYDRRLGA